MRLDMTNEQDIDLRSIPAFQSDESYNAVIADLIQAHNDVVSGKDKGIPFEQVMAELDNSLIS